MKWKWNIKNAIKRTKTNINQSDVKRKAQIQSYSTSTVVNSTAHRQKENNNRTEQTQVFIWVFLFLDSSGQTNRSVRLSDAKDKFSLNLWWLNAMSVHWFLQLLYPQTRHIQFVFDLPQMRIAYGIRATMIFQDLLRLINSTSECQWFS